MTFVFQTLVPKEQLMFAAVEESPLNAAQGGLQDAAPGIPLPTQRTPDSMTAEGVSYYSQVNKSKTQLISVLWISMPIMWR